MSDSDSSSEAETPTKELTKAEKKAAKKAKKAKKAEKKASKEAKKLAKKAKKAAAKAKKKSEKKSGKNGDSTEKSTEVEAETKDKNAKVCKDDSETNSNTNTSDNETENKNENENDSTKRKLETTEEDSDEPPLKKRKLLAKKEEMTEDTKEDTDNGSGTLNENQIAGTVLRWNNAKGFGFIGYFDTQLQKDEEIFVHCNDVYLGDHDKGDKSMAINQKVVFEMGDDAKISGKKSATNVTGPDGAACKHEEYVNGVTKLSGIVLRWNDEKGFGFVRADDKQYTESFVHWNAVKGSKKFDTTWLEVNEKIEFDLMDDPKKPGSFKAINIIGANGADLKCGIRGPGVRVNNNSSSNGNKGGQFDSLFDKKGEDNSNDNSNDNSAESKEDDKKDVKFTEGKSIGEVLSWNNDKGFGFIKPQKMGEEDIFVHASDIYSERDATSLNVGETVEYFAGEDNGRVRAQEVTGPGGRPCEGIQYLNKDGKITGRVVKWHDDKGFGFITPSDGNFSEDAFAHFRNIKGQRGFDTAWLAAGEEVEFDLKINPKNGKTEATNIAAAGGYGSKLDCQKNTY